MSVYKNIENFSQKISIYFNHQASAGNISNEKKILNLSNESFRRMNKVSNTINYTLLKKEAKLNSVNADLKLRKQKGKDTTEHEKRKDHLEEQIKSLNDQKSIFDGDNNKNNKEGIVNKFSEQFKPTENVNNIQPRKGSVKYLKKNTKKLLDDLQKMQSINKKQLKNNTGEIKDFQSLKTNLESKVGRKSMIDIEKKFYNDSIEELQNIKGELQANKTTLTEAMNKIQPYAMTIEKKDSNSSEKQHTTDRTQNAKAAEQTKKIDQESSLSDETVSPQRSTTSSPALSRKSPDSSDQKPGSSSGDVKKEQPETAVSERPPIAPKPQSPLPPTPPAAPNPNLTESQQAVKYKEEAQPAPILSETEQNNVSSSSDNDDRSNLLKEIRNGTKLRKVKSPLKENVGKSEDPLGRALQKIRDAKYGTQSGNAGQNGTDWDDQV